MEVFVMVEGGPGTVHEAECAEKNGSYVIPIFSTGTVNFLRVSLTLISGGASNGQFGYSLSKAKSILETEEINALSSLSESPEAVADAFIKIITRLSNGAV